MVENGLYFVQGLGLTDAISHHFWWKIYDNFTILHHLFYKPWAHHLAVVGNRIVES